MRSSDRRPIPASIAERGLRGVKRLACDLDRPLLEWLVPRDGAPERAFASAFEARHPDDLAGAHGKVDVDQMIVGAPLIASAGAPGGLAARGG